MLLRYAYTYIGVFYKNHRWAENWFKEVAKELGGNVVKMIISANTLVIDTVDMHIVGVSPYHENSRGHRFDRIICEPNVWEDQNIMNTIVRPMIRNPIDVDWSDENEIKEDK